VAILEPAALIAFDLWSDVDAARGRIGAALGGALPGLGRSGDLAGGWRAIRVEPSVWWLTGPLGDLDAQMARLEAAIGGDGAATDLSGGFARVAVSGDDWRAPLMIGGVLDAEDPAFGAGSTAGTILHHIGVRHDVVADRLVHIHVAPSYAADLVDHLRAAVLGLEADGAPEA
jgi:heterotetrameric sarcosine oxidase gamma subunit